MKIFANYEQENTFNRVHTKVDISALKKQYFHDRSTFLIKVRAKHTNDVKFSKYLANLFLYLAVLNFIFLSFYTETSDLIVTITTIALILLRFPFSLRKDTLINNGPYKINSVANKIFPINAFEPVSKEEHYDLDLNNPIVKKYLSRLKELDRELLHIEHFYLFKVSFPFKVV